jgi:predicted alpha/beta superfamily hydrolase
MDPHHRQIIYRKSLGGLLVLHLLFVHPETFQTYIAGDYVGQHASFVRIAV